MEFLVERASSIFNKAENLKIDLKRWKAEEKSYYSTTHKKDMMGIFIEINSLDELMEFKQLYGDIILQTNIFNPNITTLLIYDDYIE